MSTWQLAKVEEQGCLGADYFRGSPALRFPPLDEPSVAVVSALAPIGQDRHRDLCSREHMPAQGAGGADHLVIGMGRQHQHRLAVEFADEHRLLVFERSG
jgi:hypothetical protein